MGKASYNQILTIAEELLLWLKERQMAKGQWCGDNIIFPFAEQTKYNAYKVWKAWDMLKTLGKRGKTNKNCEWQIADFEPIQSMLRGNGSLVICYHGTDTEEKASRIRTEGFRPETYFAKHLEDALFMGGEYIFEVEFPCDVRFHNNPECWQFFQVNWVGAERIVAAYRIAATKLYENEELRERIFNSSELRDTTIVLGIA